MKHCWWRWWPSLQRQHGLLYLALQKMLKHFLLVLGLSHTTFFQLASYKNRMLFFVLEETYSLKKRIYLKPLLQWHSCVQSKPSEYCLDLNILDLLLQHIWLAHIAAKVHVWRLKEFDASTVCDIVLELKKPHFVTKKDHRTWFCKVR